MHRVVSYDVALLEDFITFVRSLDRNSRLLNEVDVLGVDRTYVVPARGSGVGISWTIAVQKGRVGLVIQVRQICIKT